MAGMIEYARATKTISTTSRLGTRALGPWTNIDVP